MPLSREKLGKVKVALPFFLYDDDGIAVMETVVVNEANLERQKIEYVTFIFCRRDDGEAKQQKFDQAMGGEDTPSFDLFCELLLEVSGFEDFDPTQKAELDFKGYVREYFSDFAMRRIAGQAMTQYYRRIYPADYFRDFSDHRVEVSTPHPSSEQVGA